MAAQDGDSEAGGCIDSPEASIPSVAGWLTRNGASERRNGAPHRMRHDNPSVRVAVVPDRPALAVTGQADPFSIRPELEHLASNPAQRLFRFAALSVVQSIDEMPPAYRISERPATRPPAGAAHMGKTCGLDGGGPGGQPAPRGKAAAGRWGDAVVIFADCSAGIGILATSRA